ncbi:MAG: lysophospholipid acyltransferase family protein [Candidatus Wallbacteria bacterium]|nr:lysophospholipid acyltransferase family protein [Candidatus Wallbacteria bacterium]
MASRTLGNILYLLLPSLRKIPLKNLDVLFPQMPLEGKLRIVESYFRQQCQQIWELIFVYCFPKLIKELIEDDSAHNVIDELLEKHRTVLTLSLHFGNWELLGAELVASGYKLSSVFLKPRSSFVGRLFFKFRNKAGINLVEHNEIIRLARVVRGGGLLALIADHDGGADGARMNWNGTEVSFPSGPARLASRFDLPVVGLSMERASRGLHRVRAKVLYLPGEKAVSPDSMTKTFLDFIDGEVRRKPSQWLLLYDRFKKRTYDRSETNEFL